MKARSRQLLFLLLAMTLLFAQQGAAIHALSHLGEPLPSHSQQDKKLPHSSACDKCVLYAGVGSAVAASSLIIPAGTAHALHVAAAQPALLSQLARLYHARAPPSLV
ncbi:MAG: hypothetical protein Q7V00_05450 [Sulfurimicrobium sp.]|nr:hypothetical protein [Sulfurimicrobium sp.]MDO9190216.1 hypothetical protein [Sulfurimicrobium sp.]MDP2197646.1 hypothetical protein [Sulfurimicrobium sp.]MDP3687418.1 hypothetical protein [Sulfurimicrobium sp.]